jgi:hypothetical protein
VPAVAIASSPTWPRSRTRFGDEFRSVGDNNVDVAVTMASFAGERGADDELLLDHHDLLGDEWRANSELTQRTDAPSAAEARTWVSACGYVMGGVSALTAPRQPRR